MKVPVRLTRTDTGFDFEYRTERIHIRGMPEALTLSSRDIIAYLSLLIDESPDSETDSDDDVEEVLRRCQALQPK